MKKQLFNSLVSAIVLFSFLAAPLPHRSQVRAVYDNGAAGLGQMLRRLQTTASLMHTGAHPDDEDSGLLAYAARRDSARTVYLSLNRGDGGQNVIGQELFEQLGVVRTEELLQARRLDGGEQMFTRVMDYGFSKKREEAARIWGEQLTLADMVRAIRMFRPVVIVSRFSGTPADGHGQHQLAGYLTPIAFKAAADPKQFPEHFAEGLTPWQAKKLYVSQSFVNNPSNQPTLTVNTGEFDPLIGRSYFEVSMEGRSQHKSQEMGSLELRGKFTSGMRLIETFGKKVDSESDMFDGVNTSISGIPLITDDSYTPLYPKLDALQATAAEALKSYDIYEPQKLIPILAKGYQQAVEAEGSTRNPDSKRMIRQKANEFAKALQMAAGVVVDALSSSETIVPGDSTGVAVRVFAPENSPVSVSKVSINVPKGWKAEGTSEPVQQDNMFRPRRENSRHASFFNVVTPADAKPTQPYWLENPRNPNFTFEWPDPESRNRPFQAPLMTAAVEMTIGGQAITVEREVQYRFADDIRGEIRRDVNLVPAVTVSLDQKILVVPTGAKPQTKRIVMSVTNNSSKPVSGTVSLNSNSSAELKYKASAAAFNLKSQGEKTAVTFDVEIPAKAKADEFEIYGQASIGGGGLATQEMQTIAYPHIQTHRIYARATTKVKVVDLKVAPVRVGYVMGSGDRVPAAIERLGLSVKMLDSDYLSTGDLSQFDTIVIGIRASQVRPDYVANNGRLIEFVKNGGTMIVQYQQQEFARMNMTPLPAKMESNIRTVDETAPVKILQPANPVFSFPNKITDADFSNWVQERDLYTLTEWDSKYVPLLETHDEGEKESLGGMLYLELGKGKYIYTAYSWFRQLPVGNPGAYRIFANMLSLPKAGTRSRQ